MKRIVLLIVLLYAISGFSQQVSLSEAKNIAETFLETKIDSVEVYAFEGDTLFYMAHAASTGYALVSADKQMPPVIAWSKTTSLRVFPEFFLFVKDYTKAFRAASQNFSKAKKESISQQWNDLSIGNSIKAQYESWPAAGSTSTDGWVETRWTQTQPYNQMCPKDPITNTRSYAGCPAIVMSQILNCLKTTQSTRFNDADDYLHDYDGRTYTIDNDADSLGFPSFTSLNNLLDTIDQKFQTNTLLTNSDAAALVFACGTACTQVYTSLGSGTFAVNQAYNAYKRFGFNNCELHETVDSTLYSTLISNLKNGYPTHLAIVDAQWSSGHNVIVDGYREDGYFHINFGWGGQSDGWWLVPDVNMPYSLSVLEGIILNIIPNEDALAEHKASQTLSIYPNPASETITLQMATERRTRYQIFDLNGNKVQTGKTNGQISVEKLTAGTYILQLDTQDGTKVAKLVVSKK